MLVGKFWETIDSQNRWTAHWIENPLPKNITFAGFAKSLPFALSSSLRSLSLSLVLSVRWTVVTTLYESLNSLNLSVPAKTCVYAAQSVFLKPLQTANSFWSIVAGTPTPSHSTLIFLSLLVVLGISSFRILSVIAFHSLRSVKLKARVSYKPGFRTV